MTSTCRAVEAWAERMTRLRRQHRLYLTVWEVGDPEGDLLAARHEADIAYAARCLGVPWGDMLEVVERTCDYPISSSPPCPLQRPGRSPA